MKLIFPKSKLDELRELLELNPDASAVILTHAEYGTILDQLVSENSACSVLLAQFKYIQYNGKKINVLFKEMQ